MKKLYKIFIYPMASASLCLLVATAAVAQGNVGVRPSSSSVSAPAAAPAAAPASRPSGGGGSFNNGAGVSRPSNNNNIGIARPSGPPQRGIAPQGSIQQSQGGGFNRQGNAGIPQRGNYGFAPRTGATVTNGTIPVRGNNGFAPRTGATVATGVQRGNYGYAPRNGATVVGSPARYRTVPTIGYGHGGYWGNHSYYYNNRGYYSSYYLPRLGFSIGVLPYGYYPFYYGDYQYFYSDGLFYQYGNDQYTVVEPPIGAQVTVLPEKAQSIVINGQQYYELNGVYYAPYTKDDGTLVYEVVGKDGELNTGTSVQDQPTAPQMGDVVSQLPLDCRKINVNGQKLFVSPDGIYYQEQVDANKIKSYKIVGLPSDENGQN